MKKFILFVLTLMLIASMAVTAFAATPKYQFPNLPEIPDISDNVEVEFPDNFWDNWFKEHPIKIDFSKIKWGWN